MATGVSAAQLQRTGSGCGDGRVAPEYIWKNATSAVELTDAKHEH